MPKLVHGACVTNSSPQCTNANMLNSDKAIPTANNSRIFIYIMHHNNNDKQKSLLCACADRCAPHTFHINSCTQKYIYIDIMLCSWRQMRASQQYFSLFPHMCMAYGDCHLQPRTHVYSFLRYMANGTSQKMD